MPSTPNGLPRYQQWAMLKMSLDRAIVLARVLGSIDAVDGEMFDLADVSTIGDVLAHELTAAKTLVDNLSGEGE
jgi:hypothetical protein